MEQRDFEKPVKSDHPAAPGTSSKICSKRRGKFCFEFSSVLEGLQRSITIFRHSVASKKVFWAHFALELVELIHPNDPLLFPDPVWGWKRPEIGILIFLSWRSNYFKKSTRNLSAPSTRPLSHWVLNFLFLVCFLEASVQKCRLFWALFVAQIFFPNSLSEFLRINNRISGHSQNHHQKIRYQKLFARFKFSIFFLADEKKLKHFWITDKKLKANWGWLEAGGMSRKMLFHFKLLEGSWIFCWLFYISLGQSVNY